MTDSAPYQQSSPVSAGDLLDLLNIAKVNEYGNGVWPFTMAQLLHFADPRKTYVNYRHKTIPKKSGGVREISSPVWMLKMFQSAAGRMLRSYYEAPKDVMGFVPGRSVVDNASRHTRKNYVLNADIKDFFPSITRRRVKSALMRPPFSFGKEAAHLLSGICCAYADIAKNGRTTYWDVQEARRYGIYVTVEDNNHAYLLHFLKAHLPLQYFQMPCVFGLTVDLQDLQDVTEYLIHDTQMTLPSAVTTMCFRKDIRF